MNQFDVTVIGGGPGGYVAAIRARQLGLATALIEQECLGGICLNWGCIPTKSLLRAAEIKHLIDQAEEFGLKVSLDEINVKKMVARSRQVASQLATGVKHLLKKNKVTVFEGRGVLKGKGKIGVHSKENKEIPLHAQHIILATGARPRPLGDLAPDGEAIWTAQHAMTPSILPKTLLVIGAGAIGIEFASFYRTLGVEVTVIEAQPRILPQEDAEISMMAQKLFEKQGIKFSLETTVSSLIKHANHLEATLKIAGKKEKKKVEKALLAVGITGNTEELGLENTQVKVDKGWIITNEWGQTDEPGIYAIGDVAGPPWLAHKASHEGIICVEKIAGFPDVHPLKRTRIPACTYSLPQVASIGLTEEQAKIEGHEIKVGRFPYQANGKALGMGEKEGLIKVIFDAKTAELLGAHMIGHEVTELIQGFSIAKVLETTETELMRTIFPHPTLSEIMHESVLDAYDRAIHY